MKKSEFIDELCRRLRLLPPDEAQRTVLFYSEAIDDRMEDGMTEEEAVESLGSLDDIVRDVTGSADGGVHRGGGFEGSRGSQGDTDKWEEHHYRLGSDGVCELHITDTSCDTTLELSPDNLIHVYCTEGRGVWYEITEGSVVTIRKVIEKEFRLFGFSFKLPIGNSVGRLTVQVPGDIAHRLTVLVTTASGDIRVRTPVLTRLAAKSSSGDITAERVACSGDLSMNSLSGDVHGESLTCQNGSLGTVSGDLNVSELGCLALKLSTTSGDLDADRVSCLDARVNTVSGDAEFEGSVRERFAASSVSGDINFRLLLPTQSVTLDSVSGDIEGSIAADPGSYSFNLKSTSGSRTAPQGSHDAPNSVRGKTVSGDITLNFN